METKKTIWYIKVNHPYQELGIRAYWARSEDEANAIASCLRHMHKRALVSVSASTDKKLHDLYGKPYDWRAERHENDMWSSVDRSQEPNPTMQALGYDLKVTYYHCPAQHLNKQWQITYHDEVWVRKGRIFYCYSRDGKLTRYGKAIDKAYIEKAYEAFEQQADKHIEEDRIEEDHIEEDRIEKDKHTHNQIKENDMTKDQIEKVQEAFNKANRLILTSDASGSIRANFMLDTQVVISYIVYDVGELVRYIQNNNFTRLARGIYVK